MRPLILRAIGSVSLLALIAGPLRAQTIDTTPHNHVPIGLGFGDPFISTMGQTIIPTAAQSVLLDFTFLASPRRNPDDVDFRAYVGRWDPINFRVIQPLLFASDPMTTVGKPGSPVFTEFNASIPGGLTLVPGIPYVLFFSASEFIDSQAGIADFGLRNDDPYSVGQWVWLSNVGVTSAWHDQSWAGIQGYDAAFRAHFGPSSVVPEPAALPLLGAGIVPLGLGIWKRRRAKS